MKSINTRPTRITPRKEWTSFEKYLQDICACGVDTLTPDEEVELFKKVKQWDEKARDRFIKANLRFVVSVAKQYRTSWIPLQDLIGEWNIWLMKAVERFDETRWFKFISYAVWRIRQSILQYIDNRSNTIRRPISQENIRRKIQKFEMKYLQDNWFPPSEEEIKESLSLSEKEFANYKATSPSISVKSLDDTWFSDDNDASLLDVIPDKSAKSPGLDLEINSQRDHLMKILKNNLKPWEYEILTSYYWLWWKREKTLEEIGYDLEISRERVRQIRDKACHRLAKILHWTELHKLYNSLNE